MTHIPPPPTTQTHTHQHAQQYPSCCYSAPLQYLRCHCPADMQKYNPPPIIAAEPECQPIGPVMPSCHQHWASTWMIPTYATQTFAVCTTADPSHNCSSISTSYIRCCRASPQTSKKPTATTPWKNIHHRTYAEHCHHDTKQTCYPKPIRLSGMC
jgi:hypothetical protein